VWSVRVNGQFAVGRLGARSAADLAWKTDLLRHSTVKADGAGACRDGGGPAVR
jgi:hypothetical protein